MGPPYNHLVGHREFPRCRKLHFLQLKNTEAAISHNFMQVSLKVEMCMWIILLSRLVHFVRSTGKHSANGRNFKLPGLTRFVQKHPMQLFTTKRDAKESYAQTKRGPS